MGGKTWVGSVMEGWGSGVWWGGDAGAGVCPAVPPAVTHAALCYGGSPVPGGPRPRASSRPGHSVPGGWADTACKTHRRDGGVGDEHLAVPTASSPCQCQPGRMGWGAACSPLPDFGDSPQGRQLLGSGPPCVQGGRGAGAGPCAEQAAALPHGLRHPDGDPRGWMAAAGTAQAPTGGGSSKSWELWAHRAPLPPWGLSIVASRTSCVPELSPILDTPSPGTGGGTSLAPGLWQRVPA